MEIMCVPGTSSFKEKVGCTTASKSTEGNKANASR